VAISRSNSRKSSDLFGIHCFELMLRDTCMSYLQTRSLLISF
jgi:hypothetical protein